MTNKVFIGNDKFELTPKIFSVGLILLGVLMMFFPQTRGIGPIAFGFGIGLTIKILGVK